jgi:hypothetical protein
MNLNALIAKSEGKEVFVVAIAVHKYTRIEIKAFTIGIKFAMRKVIIHNKTS